LATIQVINTDGANGSLADAYTFNTPLAPTFTSVTSNTVSGYGGSTVTIVGENYFGTPVVLFGEIAATSVTKVDANTLSVVTPAMPYGTFPIKITNPDGQFVTTENAINFTFPDLTVTGAQTIGTSSYHSITVANGGSLTIIGTTLIETGSRMDDLVYEEFKGTGNMELHLVRALAERRVYPAIDVQRSGTRQEELLYDKKIYPKIITVRKMVDMLGAEERTEIILERLAKTKSNEEFLKGLGQG
jgi:hypothetical protein